MFIFFSSCGKTYLYKISSKETTDIYVSDKVLSEEEKQEVLLNYESYLKKNNYCRDTIVKTRFKTYRVKAKKDLTIKLLHHVQHHNTFYVLEAEKR